jgi:flagellar hook assembly protein FlgD
VLGRAVRTLADDHLSAGTHEFQWNGTDGNGNRAANGIYFYRIQSGSYSLVKKMLLVK